MKKSFVFASILLSALLSSPSMHATTVDPTPDNHYANRARREGSPDLSIPNDCSGKIDSAKLDQIHQCLCFIKDNLCVQNGITPIPVFNSDENGGIITLSESNNYQVAENLVFPIVISTNKVCLDLNCREISLSDGSTNIITISSGLKYINIHNGCLINTDTPTGTGAGILIQNGSSVIQIKKVRIIGCGNGVRLDGQDGNEVIECELIALDLVSNSTGLVLSHADENVVKDCRAFHNTQAGFELLNSEANCFYDCQALKTLGDQSTMGFTSRDGQSNLFQRCVAKKTKTSAFEFCNKAHGFLLTGTEEKTKIIDCIVNETDVTSTVSAIAYGIHLAPILLEGAALLNFIDEANNPPIESVRSVAWSPDVKYIAGGSGNSVRVFSFDGSTLTHIDSTTTPPNGNVLSVAWSPDGKYIASGERASNSVRVFSFDGSNITHVDDDPAPTRDVNSVAWSPDGKYIASGDGGNFMRVFSFDGSTLTQIDSTTTPTQPNGDVLSVAWSPDGKYIASGDNGGFIRVFSFDGSDITHIVGNGTPSSIVSSVAWSPDGKYIASGDSGNFVRVFSFDGPSLSLTHIDGATAPPTNPLASVAWSPNGSYIATGDNGNFVRVFSFDGTDLTQTASNDTPTSFLYSVAWSPDGRYIASGDAGARIRVFDAMFGPENCLVQACTVGDTAAHGQFVGTGIAGGGNNCFVSNVCCNNEVNYTYGIPNVYYGRHNLARDTVQPFDNISMPTTQ